MQEITVQLPDEVYQRLARMAATLQRPLEEVLAQTIRGNLPPILDDLPLEERHLVATLAPLNDEDLRAIALTELPVQRWRRHQRLLRKAEDGALTPAEGAELATLRNEVDRFVVRRSCALSLLKWRGYTIPIASS